MHNSDIRLCVITEVHGNRINQFKNNGGFHAYKNKEIKIKVIDKCLQNINIVHDWHFQTIPAERFLTAVRVKSRALFLSTCPLGR
jgi:hypothetical protein